MTFFLKVPCTESPVVVIEATLPALTSLRKNGLNGTVTRGCVEVWSKTNDRSTLIANSATTK
jgi:hypothetical protein